MAGINKYVRDGTHVILVDGGISPSTIVRITRNSDLVIACVRTSGSAFRDFTLTFETTAQADAMWALLDAAMVP